ncbi:hypothetical protein T02_15499 [Trichinella nativa]|uniref:Uncharacterized protein n=1 Tax=Trichinella nativa TaxID=6335 RepID=A0A0V1LDB7_9BILA|nr:hypothetical protein T02_15499 [Trichinella nativa]
MHSQQYSITVLICSWENRNRIPHSGWLVLVNLFIFHSIGLSSSAFVICVICPDYSTTNALGTFLQISDAKVVYDLKQSAAKGGDAYSTLANAKWDNPLSSISDVEAVFGYFKRDSLSSVKNNKSMKLWKLRLSLYSTCLKAMFACLRRYFSFLRKIIPEHFLPRTCNGKLATMATGQLISGHQSIHANYVQFLLHWLYTVIRC